VLESTADLAIRGKTEIVAAARPKLFLQRRALEDEKSNVALPQSDASVKADWHLVFHTDRIE